MDYRSIHSYFSIFLLFVSLGVQAQSAKDVFLPGSLAVWMDAEARLNDKTGYRIPPRDNSALKSDFRAENADWFNVSSYWIPESEMNVAEIEEQIPAELRPELIRTQNGHREYRLFVHPESEGFYRPLTSKYSRAENAIARATASSRTVLMTFPNHKNLFFFAKLSLDVNLGNVVRTIPSGESMQSIGLTKYTLTTSRKLRDNFKFIPEVLGIIPKGWPRGGQIIRLVPPEILTGETTLIPMFSLTTLDGSTTILEKMIRRSGQSPRNFVLNSILRPFIEGWVEWAVKGALSMEAHGQNVLMEIDKFGMPTGRFYQRDMGGMNLDLDSPFVPKEFLTELPFASTIKADYHQDFRIKARQTSLAIYFRERILYNIDQDLKRIQADYVEGQVLEDLWIELENEIIKTTGLRKEKIDRKLLKTNMNEILSAAAQDRWRLERSRSCGGVFN